jgi:hypothetical protein
MTKFEEEFDKKVDIFNVIGNHNSMCCEVDQVKEVFKDYQPQQALPVVPDFVDKFLKSKPIFNIVKYPIPIEIISWANKQTGYMDLEINITYLIKLKTNGYTVEKPQLFYLKHIDMSKRDKECDYFAQIRNDRFEHESVQNNTLPGVEVVGVRFTQAEIDSMQIGSYEQIPVPVEDGE